jgi:hypothetical protein
MLSRFARNFFSLEYSARRPLGLSGSCMLIRTLSAEKCDKGRSFMPSRGRFHATDDMNLLELSKISGVGGYGYLLEPLWWVGMVTSKHQQFPWAHLFLIMPNLYSSVLSKLELCSACWGDRQFHRLHVCARSPRHTTGRTQYYCQV